MAIEDRKIGGQESFEGSDGNFNEVTVMVDPGQSPLRIDKFLFDRLPNVSRNRIQEGVGGGLITVNGKAVKSNYKVRPLDRILVRMPVSKDFDSEVVPEDIPLDIVYEDEDLLVVNKPSGMVVHPGIGNPRGTLVNALRYHLQSITLPILDNNPNDRPGLVHRLDKDTTGLLVIAKTQEALTHLAAQFFNHTVVRRYQSLVWGQPDELTGTVNSPIGRDPRNRTLRKVVDRAEDGKHAVTHYRVIEPMYYVSLIECRLETGRTHQIRVHLQSIGHPVFNDSKYGGARIAKGTVFQKYRQFVDNCFKLVPHHVLHAGILGFVHPRTGEEMTFEQPLPPDFAALLDKWRNYIEARNAHL